MKKRRCPACGKMRLMRRDVKSCGCRGTNPNVAAVPLVGLYFLRTEDRTCGKVLAKIGSQYLLGDSESKQLVPASWMTGWVFKDKPWSKQDIDKQVA